MERYRASGLGLKRFAAEHGLEAGRLHYWVYGRERTTRTLPQAPVFRELTAPLGWANPEPWAAEIGWADGTTLRLGERADPQWVSALVQALRTPCSR